MIYHLLNLILLAHNGSQVQPLQRVTHFAVPLFGGFFSYSTITAWCVRFPNGTLQGSHDRLFDAFAEAMKGASP